MRNWEIKCTPKPFPDVKYSLVSTCPSDLCGRTGLKMHASHIFTFSPAFSTRSSPNCAIESSLRRNSCLGKDSLTSCTAEAKTQSAGQRTMESLLPAWHLSQQQWSSRWYPQSLHRHPAPSLSALRENSIASAMRELQSLPLVFREY